MSKIEQLKIYGNIGLVHNGNSISDQIEKLEKSGCKDLRIRVHSYGGSVFEGDVIGGALSRSKMNIHIAIDGIAASMACMLLTYLPYENISIAENGFGMVHRPTGNSHGDADDHLHTAKLLSDIESNFIRTLSERTGQTPSDIKRKFFDGKDHWLNADEMIKYKLAGYKVRSIATISELDKNRIEKMSEESVYGHFAALAAGAINTNGKNSKVMKIELIETFKLEGVDAESSDTAVLNKLKEKFDALENQVKSNTEKEETEKNRQIKSILDGAQRDGKINNTVRSSLETVGKTSGVQVLSSLVDGLPRKAPIASFIKDGKTTKTEPEDTTKDKSKWTLDDYRMHAPNELKNNPSLYEQLVKNEYGED